MSFALPDPLPPNYFTEDRGHILIVVPTIFLVLINTTFVLRQISRHILKISFGWDDALVVVALLANVTNAIFTILAVPLSGVGRHTLVVVGENMEHMNKLEFMGLNGLLITPITYALAVATSKGAILLLYLKIFRFGYTRWICYGVGAVVTVHALAIIFVSIFQCSPISSLWKDINHANCIDTRIFFGCASVPNLITDLVMLFTPMPEIWRLNTSKQMKIGVTITILTASVGIIVSIVRTIAHFRTEIFFDPLWQSVNLMVYDVAEPSTYFLCACFLSLRPLLRWTRDKMSTIQRSFYSRERLASDSGLVLGDSEEGSKKHSKKVRGFNSIMLSEISGQDSVVGHKSGGVPTR